MHACIHSISSYIQRILETIKPTLMSSLVMFTSRTAVVQLTILSFTNLRGRDNDDNVVAEHGRHESIPVNAGKDVVHRQFLQRVDQQSQTHEPVNGHVFFSTNVKTRIALYENHKKMDSANKYAYQRKLAMINTACSRIWIHERASATDVETASALCVSMRTWFQGLCVCMRTCRVMLHMGALNKYKANPTHILTLRLKTGRSCFTVKNGRKTKCGMRIIAIAASSIMAMAIMIFFTCGERIASSDN